MATENQELPSEPSFSAGSGVGQLLKSGRERRGENLAYVAEALRIRQPYLEAIEAGRFQQLPGSTYAVGFIRGYAEYLGLDSKEIVRRFHQENAEFSSRAELVFPSAVSEGSIPSASLLLVAVIAAAGLYGAWYWYQSREVSIADAVPPLPERLVALLHRPVGSGQELVPVNQADSAKINEAPLPGQVGPVPATPPLLGNHEDVVPPSEEDGAQPPAAASVPSGTTTPQISTSQAPAAPAPVPQQPAASPTASPGSAAQLGAPASPAVQSQRAGEPPADAAVTPADPSVAAPRKGRGRDKQPPAADATVQTPPAPLPAPLASAAPTVQPAPANQPAPPPVSAPASAEQPPADAAGPGRTVLRANEDCWIEIRDGKGRVVQSRLLRKGESYAVTRRSGMRMTVGNAGALSMVVDGKETGPLGAAGMVRKGVTLDGSQPAEVQAPAAETPAEGSPEATPPATPPVQ